MKQSDWEGIKAIVYCVCGLTGIFMLQDMSDTFSIILGSFMAGFGFMYCGYHVRINQELCKIK